MPTSKLEAAPAVLHLIWQIRDDVGSILDVGPGWGKYERLIREYVYGHERPQPMIAAVEAWPGYVDRHGLAARYDRLIVGPVEAQPPEILDLFDLVLMVDVIEHIEKDQARQLLDRIPGWVIISTPVHWFEQEHPDNPHETHVSHWKHRDWIELGCTPIENHHDAWVVRRPPHRD